MLDLYIKCIIKNKVEIYKQLKIKNLTNIKNLKIKSHLALEYYAMFEWRKHNSRVPRQGR